MQTPKARTSPSGTPQKKSPQTNSPKTVSSEVPEKVSPRVVRQLKTGARFLEPTASSINQATKAAKAGSSPKVAERKSPKTSVSEKKRPTREVELESQISQLEHDLKTVKNQLCSSEQSKKLAQKDVEESNQQLEILSTKLEESQKLLLEKSVPQEINAVDLGETPEKCNQTIVPSVEAEPQNQTLVSEVEAIRNQHLQDSAALASALDEANKLKLQLEKLTESEAAQTKDTESAEIELRKLKENLAEKKVLVEDMTNELKSCKESEAQAKTVASETLVQLETAKKMMEALRSDGSKATEAYDSVVTELNQSKARVDALEELVSKLKVEIEDSQKEIERQKDLEESEKRSKEFVETELKSMKIEVQQLKTTLEAAEIRYNEEQSRSSEHMRNAVEMAEQIKSAAGQREAELEAELRKSKYLIEELKANLMDKETELQGICEENEELASKLEGQLRKSIADRDILQADLMDKENELQNASETNETLKSEIYEIGKAEVGKVVVSDLEAAKAAEREALMKVGYMTEEVDKSNRKAARVAEQLEAAQAANAEVEAELRRLKVQSNQWRKAAEAAAAMLSAGNNGQIIERTGSMDSNYSPRMGRIHSPYGDDIDEDLLKKKNANVLKKIGVLWKKPQK